MTGTDEATFETTPAAATGTAHRPTTWSVFTKPWPTLALPDLAALVASLGFDAVEFPLRPGFQIDLDDLPRSAATAARVFADHGIRIASAASTPTAAVFQTCAEVGIPMIRIMAPREPDGPAATDARLRQLLDSLLPLGDGTGVKVGIQPHIDCHMADSSDLATLLRDYDPASVVAVWDAAHDALARKDPAEAFDRLGSHLAMVNFKNACYRPGPRRADGSQAWETVFVPGVDGLSDWAAAVGALRDRSWSGTVCMPAEYSDESALLDVLRADVSYLRSLVDGGDAA